MGAFTQQDIDEFVTKDEKNNAVGLDLPTKFVLIANHQVSSGSAETYPLLIVPRSMQTGGMPGVSPIL